MIPGGTVGMRVWGYSIRGGGGEGLFSLSGRKQAAGSSKLSGHCLLCLANGGWWRRMRGVRERLPPGLIGAVEKEMGGLLTNWEFLVEVIDGPESMNGVVGGSVA